MSLVTDWESRQQTILVQGKATEVTCHREGSPVTSKPASDGHLKTSHFEGRIASWAAKAAHARKNSIVVVHTMGRDVRKFDKLRALHNLKQIDTSNCPGEFRAAWLAYIQAWERFATPSPTERKQKQILASPTSRSIGGNLEGHAGFGNGIGGGISGQYNTTHENNAKLAELYDKEDTSEVMVALIRRRDKSRLTTPAILEKVASSREIKAAFC